MSKVYNLNEQVGSDYFNIQIDEHRYKMYYPSGRDVMEVQEMAEKSHELNDQLEAAQKSGNTKKVAELTKTTKEAQTSFLDWCIKYVQVESENAPDFKELILGKNMKYLIAFVNMVREELN